MRSLGFTPIQQAELQADPQRALEWIVFARGKILRSPAGFVLSKFRTGEWPPDPNAWRAGAQPPPKPNHAALQRASMALVKNIGHHVDWRYLEEEFRTLEQRTRAKLTDEDVKRLFETWEAIQLRGDAA